jgi:hypothetical protein
LTRNRGTQPANNTGHLFGMSQEMHKSGLIQMADVKGNVELGTGFGAGRFGDGKELMELATSSTLETFGNIWVHGRFW